MLLGLMMTMKQIVQLLIERGCQYSARNNQGFTASDYAYSLSRFSFVHFRILKLL
jgi:ankyrin repeat protein